MNPQMRMLILLAVFWVAGSLLLAAESPSTPKPAAAAQKPAAAEKPAVEKPGAAAKPAAEEKPVAEEKKAAAEESKTDTAQDKGSIADQAEAALKAAAEAGPGGAPSETPKTEAAQEKDDTQVAPTASAGRGPSPQRFVPTEQVRADFDVSFPIDI